MAWVPAKASYRTQKVWLGGGRCQCGKNVMSIAMSDCRQKCDSQQVRLQARERVCAVLRVLTDTAERQTGNLSGRVIECQEQPCQ